MAPTNRRPFLMSLLGMVLLASSGCSSTGWRAQLTSRLPAYGHRNWIVIANSAYPKQTAEGVDTIATGADHIKVLRTVLRRVEAAPHVQAIVFLDEELESVIEADAPGITAYRSRVNTLLKGKQFQAMPQDQIISRLNRGAKTYSVLILKTTMTLPYTSLFLRLDCEYWNEEKEQRLRAAMERKK